ncbi:MAG: protein kinase [Planctomycetes bacterium]|nr:protein kinase [Planctomycetota bacterium]
MAQARCLHCGELFKLEGVAEGGRVTCPRCGRTLQRSNTTQGMTAPTNPTATGEQKEIIIGGFKITGAMRQGGMGIVYEGIQLSLGRKVAIKVLSEKIASKPTSVARFRREAEILVALRHPNIVAILDRGEFNGRPYYVMEYVEGPGADKAPITLEDLIRDRALYPEQVRDLAIQIGDALKFAHSHGIVHRDIKPSNILINALGYACILDFGIAQFKEHSRSSVTRENVGMGTTDYMAPEQSIDAANVDHRADIYSFGVMLYEMLVGDIPRGAFDPPSRLVPGLNPRWDALIIKCLKTDREQRYPFLEPMISDLKAIEPASFGVGKSARTPVPTPPNSVTVVGTTAPPATTSPRTDGTSEAREEVPRLRKAYEEADATFRQQVSALGEALVAQQGTTLHRDAQIQSYLKEARGVRERLAKIEDLCREIRALTDRQAELDKSLAGLVADQKAIDREIAGQWLPIGERAWDLFARKRPTTDVHIELFEAPLAFQATLEALRDRMKQIDQEVESAGMWAKGKAALKKVAIQAELSTKSLGRQAPLEAAGRKVYESNFGEEMADPDLDRLLQQAKDREEGKAQLAAEAAGLQGEKDGVIGKLRGLGVTSRAQQRLDELGGEARKLHLRLDEIYAALGSWATENESALPSDDEAVTSLMGSARQSRAVRNDLRLKLKMLEARAGVRRPTKGTGPGPTGPGK